MTLRRRRGVAWWRGVLAVRGRSVAVVVVAAAAAGLSATSCVDGRRLVGGAAEVLVDDGDGYDEAFC